MKCIRRPEYTWTKCTCPPCRERTRRLKKRNAAGLVRPSRVEEAWAEIERLLVLGWSSDAIASATGVPRRTMRAALQMRSHGVTRRFGRPTVEKILNHGAPTVGHVGMLPARRRLQALAAIGWPHAELAALSGVAVMTLSYLRSGTRIEHTTPRTDRAVRDLYDELSMTPGPSDRVRRDALARGWAPPLAYDDIDDLSEEPKGVGYRAPRVADLDEWARLTAAGEDPVRAAVRLGVTISAIAKAADRHGRTDIAHTAAHARTATRSAA